MLSKLSNKIDIKQLIQIIMIGMKWLFQILIVLPVFWTYTYLFYRFATREKNALLLYNGRFNEKHDFIALEIMNEQIQLTFSAGKFMHLCICMYLYV